MPSSIDSQFPQRIALLAQLSLLMSWTSADDLSGGGAAIAVMLLPSLPYVYGLVALVRFGDFVLLLVLERVDLSDTGQVARSRLDPRSQRPRYAVTRRVATSCVPSPCAA
jgi:hypothetical protein